jgi:predicted ATPase/DNA-binding NarL/FixJ family response regulator
VTSHTLPHLSTPFVGRQDELDRIRQLFSDPTCRLLTLVGPGGIGKTRLALEAARLNLEAFEDGVYFIPFQPLTSPDFMVSAIAEAIGFQFYPGSDPKQQLLGYLRERSSLLVMDNLEHLLDGVHLLSDILSAAPEVQILATSRERLSLVEEYVLDVGGLSYPPDDTSVESYTAVELFVQQAKRVHVGFALTDEQKPAISRICRLTRGMPLAIELAAAWVRALSCEDIAAELERSLDILETSVRNAPERHRSLRATLEPTWRRLTEDERKVFIRLSVFQGGFTREAAEQVAGASLRTLTALVDKSLLRVNASGRYDLHELLRQYGEEQLNVMQDESAQVHNLHCAYYTEFLHRREGELKGHRQKLALIDIDAEMDNTRAAWDWALAQGQPDAIGKASECLRYFFDVRGRCHEGETVFGKVVERLEASGLADEQSVTLGKILLGQASCCFGSGLFEQTYMLVQKCLPIFRSHEAQWETALALNIMGRAAPAKYLRKRCIEESLSISRAIAARWLTAYTVLYLYETQLVSDYDQARQVYQDNLVLILELGDGWLMFKALSRYGWHALFVGDYLRCKELIIEALAICREFDFLWGIADCLRILGNLMQELRDFEESAHLLQESLALAKSAGYQEHIAFCLESLSNLARLQGRYDEAYRLARECLAAFTKAGIRKYLANPFTSLGGAACGMQNYHEAWEWFREGVRAAMEAESIGLMMFVLGYMAELPLAEENYDLAVQLVVISLQHAESWRETQDQARRCLVRLEAQVSPEMIASIRAGWQTSQFDAHQLAEALDITSEDVNGLLAGLRKPLISLETNTQSLRTSLSERELEILRLMADGLSNREIAEQLALAVSTIKWYASEIFSKLGVSSRTQAIARADTLGLLD